jgi:hypothetical protein
MFGGVVNATTEDGNNYVLIPAARFNRPDRSVRSDAADSSRETVRMKGGQSRDAGSKESQGGGWMSGEMRGQGGVGKVGFWWSGGFCGQGQGDRERWKGIGVGCGE